MAEERQRPSLAVHFKWCLFCRGSKKMTEKRQGPSLGVHFEMVSVL